MRKRLYGVSGYDQVENYHEVEDYPWYTLGRRRRIYGANAEGTKDKATKYDEIT